MRIWILLLLISCGPKVDDKEDKAPSYPTDNKPEEPIEFPDME